MTGAMPITEPSTLVASGLGRLRPLSREEVGLASSRLLPREQISRVLPSGQAVQEWKAAQGPLGASSIDGQFVGVEWACVALSRDRDLLEALAPLRRRRVSP